jgi:hypothetical protein
MCWKSIKDHLRANNKHKWDGLWSRRFCFDEEKKLYFVFLKTIASQLLIIKLGMIILSCVHNSHLLTNWKHSLQDLTSQAKCTQNRRLQFLYNRYIVIMEMYTQQTFEKKCWFYVAFDEALNLHNFCVRCPNNVILMHWNPLDIQNIAQPLSCVVGLVIDSRINPPDVGILAFRIKFEFKTIGWCYVAKKKHGNLMSTLNYRICPQCLLC